MDFLEFRFDYLGLSTEGKPNQNLVNGTTFYEVDTMKFYIYYKGTWYLQGEEEETDLSNIESGE